jgi:formylglycine-generating enzyme required for sulfatase activity
MVTWFDAVLFCNARSKGEGWDTVYTYTSTSGEPGNQCTALGGLTIDPTRKGYRLPTEAEREYACRAGTTSTYYWGGATDAATADRYAWYTSNSGGTTHPVATKQKNAFGLYDMSGNVWEWCNDWYGTYVAGAVTDPTGASSSSKRTLRGGFWDSDVVDDLRSADRGSTFPDAWYAGAGLRCVLPR